MKFEKNIISYLLDCHISENRKFVNKNCEMIDVYNLPIKPVDDNYTKFLTLMFDAEVYKDSSFLIYAEQFISGQPLYYFDVDYTKDESGFHLNIGEKTLNVGLVSEIVKDEKLLTYIVDNPELDLMPILKMPVESKKRLILVKTKDENCVENELRKMIDA